PVCHDVVAAPPSQLIVQETAARPDPAPKPGANVAARAHTTTNPANREPWCNNATPSAKSIAAPWLNPQPRTNMSQAAASRSRLSTCPHQATGIPSGIALQGLRCRLDNQRVD